MTDQTFRGKNVYGRGGRGGRGRGKNKMNRGSRSYGTAPCDGESKFMPFDPTLPNGFTYENPDCLLDEAGWPQDGTAIIALPLGVVRQMRIEKAAQQAAMLLADIESRQNAWTNFGTIIEQQDACIFAEARGKIEEAKTSRFRPEFKEHYIPIVKRASHTATKADDSSHTSGNSPASTVISTSQTIKESSSEKSVSPIIGTEKSTAIPEESTASHEKINARSLVLKEDDEPGEDFSGSYSLPPEEEVKYGHNGEVMAAGIDTQSPDNVKGSALESVPGFRASENALEYDGSSNSSSVSANFDTAVSYHHISTFAPMAEISPRNLRCSKHAPKSDEDETFPVATPKISRPFKLRSTNTPKVVEHKSPSPLVDAVLAKASLATYGHSDAFKLDKGDTEESTPRGMRSQHGHSNKARSSHDAFPSP